MGEGETAGVWAGGGWKEDGRGLVASGGMRRFAPVLGCTQMNKQAELGYERSIPRCAERPWAAVIPPQKEKVALLTLLSGNWCELSEELLD